MHAAHRAWAARLAGRSADDRVVIAVSTGIELDSADIHADDLLVMPGEVIADINEPAEVARLPRHVPDEDDIDREATG